MGLSQNWHGQRWCSYFSPNHKIKSLNSVESEIFFYYYFENKNARFTYCYFSIFTIFNARKITFYTIYLLGGRHMIDWKGVRTVSHYYIDPI